MLYELEYTTTDWVIKFAKLESKTENPHPLIPYMKMSFEAALLNPFLFTDYCAEWEMQEKKLCRGASGNMNMDLIDAKNACDQSENCACISCRKNRNQKWVINISACWAATRILLLPACFSWKTVQNKYNSRYYSFFLFWNLRESVTDFRSDNDMRFKCPIVGIFICLFRTIIRKPALLTLS